MGQKSHHSPDNAIAEKASFSGRITAVAVTEMSLAYLVIQSHKNVKSFFAAEWSLKEFM